MVRDPDRRAFCSGLYAELNQVSIKMKVHIKLEPFWHTYLGNLLAYSLNVLLVQFQAISTTRQRIYITYRGTSLLSCRLLLLRLKKKVILLQFLYEIVQVNEISETSPYSTISIVELSYD